MIECGARLVGWAAGLEDSAAHGRQLDVVRVAGHYWLRSDHIDIPLDFTHYLSRHGVHVIGNTLESGVAAAVHGVGRMEADPAFYRWVRKPRVGRSVEPTISTETILWGVHLVSADKSELDAAAQWALRNIVVDVSPAYIVPGKEPMSKLSVDEGLVANVRVRPMGGTVRVFVDVIAWPNYQVFSDGSSVTLKIDPYHQRSKNPAAPR